MKISAYLLFHGLALTNCALAAEVTANYDNLPATVVAAGNLGTYEYITYTSFALSNRGEAVAGGTAAHTEPNAIFTSSQRSTTSGTPSLTVAAPYTSFALTDFWFGCDGALDESAANVALQCTITVAAFQSSSDKEVAVASFTFTPPASVVAQVPMIHAVLPSAFRSPGIKNVTIVQNNPVTQALLIDSVSYYLQK